MIILALHSSRVWCSSFINDIVAVLIGAIVVCSLIITTSIITKITIWIDTCCVIRPLIDIIDSISNIVSIISTSVVILIEVTLIDLVNMLLLLLQLLSTLIQRVNVISVKNVLTVVRHRNIIMRVLLLMLGFLVFLLSLHITTLSLLHE